MAGTRACKESDWKLFRSRIDGWQESFMEGLCDEYAGILSGGGAASKRFWSLCERIENDRHKAGVVISPRRSTLASDLARLLAEGAITLDDLDGFSDELRELLSFSVKHE